MNCEFTNDMDTKMDKTTKRNIITKITEMVEFDSQKHNRTPNIVMRTAMTAVNKKVAG